MRNLGAVILAAGGSTRLGRPKQFLQWQGESLVRRAVRAASEAGCVRVAVVIGDAGQRIEAELRQTSAEAVVNFDWRRGLGTSIRVGLQHVLNSNEQLDAVLLLACDQPFVDAMLIGTLIRRWESSGKAMVACRYADTLGVPALFDRSRFAALLTLPDESGAKALLRSGINDVAELEFEAGALDIDTAADFERAKSRLGES